MHIFLHLLYLTRPLITDDRPKGRNDQIIPESLPKNLPTDFGLGNSDENTHLLRRHFPLTPILNSFIIVRLIKYARTLIYAHARECVCVSVGQVDIFIQWTNWLESTDRDRWLIVRYDMSTAVDFAGSSEDTRADRVPLKIKFTTPREDVIVFCVSPLSP